MTINIKPSNKEPLKKVMGDRGINPLYRITFFKVLVLV